METTIEQLEQQNQELKTQNQLLQEQLTQIQEQLKMKGCVGQMTRFYENSKGFTPQYEMPLDWNDDAEEQQQPRQIEQAGQSKAQGSGPGPKATPQPPPFERMKWDLLEERIRAIEGSGNRGLEAPDLCLVSNIPLPPDFKMPKFEKYKGSTCPRIHLAMYCRKMAAYQYQDSILIYYFHKSLTGAALRWFISLENLAPDRSRLQSLSKRDSEDFKDYVQRWRELAAQVYLPIPKREMVPMFIETLLLAYYKKTLGNMASSFVNLVLIGEKIEIAIRRGKIPTTSSSLSHVKRSNVDKWKADTNAVIIDASKAQEQTKFTLGGYSTQTPASGSGGTPKTHQKRTLTPVPMSYTALLPILLQKQLITTMPLRPQEPPYSKTYDPNTKCDFHEGGIGHSTERCWTLKHKVQDLVDGGWIKFRENEPNIDTNPLPAHGGQFINTLSHGMAGRKDAPPIEPLIIYYDPAPQPTLVIIDHPARPAYKDNHAVPWSYYPTSENRVKVTNIMAPGGMTRSGRIYTPEKLTKKVPTTEEAPRPTKDVPPAMEARDFLQHIQSSACELIEQMDKTPARISLLSLLLNSNKHRNRLIEVLSQAHVPKDITIERFVGIVNDISNRGQLTFSEEDLPAEGQGHNQPLYISVRCKGYTITKVLIDNGSSLNLLPKATLDKLKSVQIQLQPSPVIVRAFDGSQKDVLGEITLPIYIGPALFEITFQVMDIRAAYNCLLGRPWIHEAGTVPSSLHQKVKFISGPHLVSIFTEREIVATTSAPEEYIEGDADIQGISL
ncbi:hypothetical protein CR513_34540, partial [Mucuna pruriens]